MVFTPPGRWCQFHLRLRDSSTRICVLTPLPEMAAYGLTSEQLQSRDRVHITFRWRQFRHLRALALTQNHTLNPHAGGGADLSLTLT